MKFNNQLNEKNKPIWSTAVLADNEKGPENYPMLVGVKEKQLRMLIFMGWLNTQKSNEEILSGSDYKILGPGRTWFYMKQMKLTQSIAKKANSVAWFGLGVGIANAFFYIVNSLKCYVPN